MNLSKLSGVWVPLYPGAAPQVARAEPWRQAIDDALVAGGQDCLGPDESPAAAVNRLISHEVRVALDPAVSSEAQALIERGRAEPAGGRDEREDALREALELIAGTDPVDAALDPQRAVRVARAALDAARASLAASQQPKDSGVPAGAVALSVAGSSDRSRDVPRVSIWDFPDDYEVN
jgi:hypothetical protein